MDDSPASHEHIDAVANKVAQKLLTRDIYNAARFLVSMGFHVLSGKDAFKSSIPFSGDVSMDELRNPLGFFKLDDSGRFDLDEGPRLLQMRNIAAEINSRGLSGSIAELGVFKGDFAVEIRKQFPGRRFYLCDTFEGFSSREIERERANFAETRAFNAAAFKNTSVDSLLVRMGDSENCVIKKGYFSDTKSGMDDAFVYVHIDTDFHDSILEGLEFFYPRLVPGGFIMVHDYNNPELTGVKAAVREFCATHRIPYSPGADISAVIAKPL